MCNRSLCDDADILLSNSLKRTKGYTKRAVLNGLEKSPEFNKLDEKGLCRINIICFDPLARVGISHLLKKLPFIELNTSDYIPELSVLADNHIVIWLRVRNDGMPDLAGYVVRVCRQLPYIKQLVISDALPYTTPPGQGPLSGVWLARGTESVDMLLALCRELIRVPQSFGPLLKPRLGPMQWRILQLRAAGIDAKNIATICRISVKTVSAHESLLRDKLGVKCRVEYFWLLRSVANIFAEIPALCRYFNKSNKQVEKVLLWR